MAVFETFCALIFFCWCFFLREKGCDLMKRMAELIIYE